MLKMDKIVQNIKNKAPLIQCISNHVSLNDCANIILAVGGSPVMGDLPQEAKDFTRLAQGVVINMGNIDSARLDAMVISGQVANERGIPVVLDPVAAGMSGYRNQALDLLLSKVSFTCIRGNASEIKFLAQAGGQTQGVDASSQDLINQDNILQMEEMARKLSRKTGAVIVISGPMDLITDGASSYLVKNGHPIMTSVTGTGCMLTSLLGAYLGGNPTRSLEAALYGSIHMGLAGELAQKQMEKEGLGIASFKNYLFDHTYNLKEKDIEELKNIEKIR